MRTRKWRCRLRRLIRLSRHRRILPPIRLLLPIRSDAQVEFSLADQKVVSSGIIIFGLSMLIPVIGLLYVKLEKVILRRAGIPPIEEHIASLKMPDQAIEEPMELRKAA